MIPRTAVWIVFFALAGKLLLLRAVYPVRPESFVYIDTGTYVRPARALLSTGHFSPSPARAPEPEIIRTLGFPLLVAAVYGSFGERPWILSALGALFSAGTALIAAALAARLFGEREGVLAALLLSADFGSFFRSLDLLSDTTFTFFLVAGLALLVRAAERERPGTAAAAGALLGVATLVRPISLYLLPLLAAGLFLTTLRRGAARAARLVFAASLPCALLVGGWIVRNRLATGRYLLSPVASSELLFYRGAKVLSLATGASYPEVQAWLGNRERWWREGGAELEEEIFGKERYADLFPETSKLPLPELEARWGRQALEIFARHPAETFLMAAQGTALLILTPPVLLFANQYGILRAPPELRMLYERQEVVPFSESLLRESPGVAGFSLLTLGFLAAVLLLAVRSLVHADLGRHPAAHVLLLVTLAYLVVVSAGPEACDDRYRLPLMPLLCLYAAAAFSRPS